MFATTFRCVHAWLYTPRRSVRLRLLSRFSVSAHMSRPVSPSPSNGGIGIWIVPFGASSSLYRTRHTSVMVGPAHLQSSFSAAFLSSSASAVPFRSRPRLRSSYLTLATRIRVGLSPTGPSRFSSRTIGGVEVPAVVGFDHAEGFVNVGAQNGGSDFRRESVGGDGIGFFCHGDHDGILPSAQPQVSSNQLPAPPAFPLPSSSIAGGRGVGGRRGYIELLALNTCDTRGRQQPHPVWTEQDRNTAANKSSRPCAYEEAKIEADDLNRRPSIAVTKYSVASDDDPYAL